MTTLARRGLRIFRRALEVGVLVQAGAASLALAADNGSTVAGQTIVGESAPSIVVSNLLGTPSPGMMGNCVPRQLNTTVLSTSATKQDYPQLAHYLQPYASFGELYSDNITLAPDGQKRSDFATVLTPGISGCTVGSRVQLNFDYAAEMIRYATNPPDNKVYNQFTGNLHADLYSDHLFFDSNTSYGQAVIDPLAPYSTSNVFATTTNRVNVWSSRYSPYWVQSLGPLGIARLRYTYGRVVYTGGGDSRLNNSRNWSKSFVLNSPSSNVGWSWMANWLSSRVKQEGDGTTNYFDTASLQLGYQIFYNTRLLVTGGVETDYKPDGTVKRYGSRFWNAGLQWANPYASLKILYGHRFFGHSWLANGNYRTKSWNFGLAYTETPTVNSLQQTQQISTQTTSALAVTPLNQLQNTSVFVDKQWSANATYLMSRSHVNFGVFDQRKEYRPVSLGNDRTTGGSVGWGWQMSARTKVNANFNRERLLSGSNPNISDFLNTSSFGISYAVLTNAELSFVVTRQTRRSPIYVNTYTANSALVQISAIF